MRATRTYMALLVAFVLTTHLSAAEAESNEYVLRQFVIDAALVTYVPGEGIEGYSDLGSATSVVPGSPHLGVKINGVRSMAVITSRFKEGRLVVTVDVEPQNAGQ